MSKKTVFVMAIATAVAGIGAGSVVGTVMAADDPAVVTAKRLGITKYEDDAHVGGGGAPQKVLVDNDVTRVNLVSFPAGFDRAGHLLRRNNQLLVYIDESDYTITWNGVTGETIAKDKQKPSKLAPGSAVYHPRDTVVSDSHVGHPYRVVFVEMKK